MSMVLKAPTFSTADGLQLVAHGKRWTRARTVASSNGPCGLGSVAHLDLLAHLVISTICLIRHQKW